MKLFFPKPLTWKQSFPSQSNVGHRFAIWSHHKQKQYLCAFCVFCQRTMTKKNIFNTFSLLVFLINFAFQVMEGSVSSHDSLELPHQVINGQFVIADTWTLNSQITSLVLYKCMDSQYLLVSQPGGMFVNLTSQVSIWQIFCFTIHCFITYIMCIYIYTWFVQVLESLGKLWESLYFLSQDLENLGDFLFLTSELWKSFEFFW